MRISEEQINEILADLQGTCEPLFVVVERVIGLAPEELPREEEQRLYDAIDNAYFECETCGWWCEASAEYSSEDGICIDCNPEEEE